MGHLSNLKNPRTLLRTQSFNFSTTVSKNGGLQRSVSLAKPNIRNGSERPFWKRKKSVKDRCTCGNLLFKNEFLQPSRSRYVCVKKCMNLVVKYVVQHTALFAMRCCIALFHIIFDRYKIPWRSGMTSLDNLNQCNAQS